MQFAQAEQTMQITYKSDIGELKWFGLAMWLFLEDGATCRTTKETMDLLKTRTSDLNSFIYNSKLVFNITAMLLAIKMKNRRIQFTN